ncbi:hypothetical protein ACFVIM_00590 [Streptomyces sp. NPDC057638]|uniref:hypothetical protein n=1 Tax=Streptomyces sp. NPDC057638 TaxID=3346190 RepID=UPI00367AA433
MTSSTSTPVALALQLFTVPTLLAQRSEASFDPNLQVSVLVDGTLRAADPKAPDGRSMTRRGMTSKSEHEIGSVLVTGGWPAALC